MTKKNYNIIKQLLPSTNTGLFVDDNFQNKIYLTFYEFFFLLYTIFILT